MRCASRVKSIAASLALALLLAGCAQPPAPAPELLSINERLTRLEAQVSSLERLLTNLPSPPMRSRAEIVADIRSLELQRSELLQKYTPSHPDVRDVDLRLRLLRLQVEFLDQASRVPQ